LDLGEARLKEAHAKKDEALAAIEEAEHKLSFTSVRSPFDGVIDRIPFKMGSLVSDGDLLTTLSDNSYMYAYFDVSENEYLQAKKALDSRFAHDKQAILVLSDGSCYPLEGKIETHESQFSENTGSIAFRAVFPNQNNILKHGASGKVRIQTKLGQIILVPQKSVFEIQDKSFVYLVGKDSVVNSRSFRPLLRLADYYVVDSGLVAGEQIVYEGTQNIKEGIRVTPVFKDWNSIVAAH
jgi:membrane fusion protein (multidrug efflux system)